jgi:hypothetical protein
MNLFDAQSPRMVDQQLDTTSRQHHQTLRAISAAIHG